MNEKNSGLRILVAIRFAPSIPYIDVTGFKVRLGRCLHYSQPTGQSKILRLIISMFCDRVNHMDGLRTCVFCGFSHAGQSCRLDFSGSWFGGHLPGLNVLSECSDCTSGYIFVLSTFAPGHFTRCLAYSDPPDAHDAGLGTICPVHGLSAMTKVKTVHLGTSLGKGVHLDRW